MKKIIPFLLLLVVLVAQAGPPLNWSATGGAFYPSVGQVQMPAGTSGAPGSTITGSLSSGFFWPAADTLAVSVSGVEKWRENSTGIGINKSASLVASLTVKNPAGDTIGQNIRMENAAGSKFWDFYPHGSGQFYIANSADAAYFAFNGTGSFSVSTGGTVAGAPIEVFGSTETSTTPETFALSTSAINHSGLAITNASSTNNNYSMLAFGSGSSLWTSGIAGVNETHTGSPTGHLSFFVNNAGTIAETVRMLANKTMQFFGYGAGVLHTSASGVVSASTIVNADISAVAAIDLSKLAPLTGYVSGAGTVAATDTVLQAIQKLNGNASAGGGGGGITFQQFGGLSIMDDFGGPAPVTAATSISSVTVAMCATGASGHTTTFSIKQYTGTTLDATVTGSVTGTGNNCAISTSGPYQATVSLSGTLTVAAGDTLVANLTAVAGGAQDITISATTASNISTFTSTAVPYANSSGILTQDILNLFWTTGSSTLNASVVATGGGSSATNAGVIVKNGHLKSTQTTAPTAAVQAGAGGGGTCVLTNATDMAGTVTLTAGTVTLASGAECIITFNKAYNVAPLCVMWPVNSATALAIATIGEYVTSNTTTMNVNFGAAPITLVVYAWNYQCVETQ